MFKVLVLFFFSTSLFAKPLFEIGMAVGGGFIPDYPGADEGRVRSLAFPSFIYRGDIFKSDRRGTRALFMTSEKWDFDFSFVAAFPIEAEDNTARQGMKDLDWLFEIGPRLTYYFYKTDKQIFALELPLRFVTSTNFSFTRERGQRFIPQLDYRRFVNENWRYGFSYKLNYATNNLNDYVYSVSAAEATATREEFDASAGFIGQDLSAAIVFRKESFIGVIGIRYSEFYNSTNANSPLLRADNNTAVFMAFNWFFYKSERQGWVDQNGEF